MYTREHILKVITEFESKKQHAKRFIKLYRDEWDIILVATSEFITTSVRQRLHHYKIESTEIPQCLSCDKKVSWVGYDYNRFCSNICNINSPLTKQKSKERCIEKFGVENPFQSKELMKHCVNPSKNDDIQKLKKKNREDKVSSGEFAKKQKKRASENLNYWFVGGRKVVVSDNIYQMLSSRDEMYKMLIVDNFSVGEISKKYDIPVGLMRRWIIKHNIVESKRNLKKVDVEILENYDYMYDLHVTQKLRQTEIAKKLKLSNSTIGRALRKLNIRPRYYYGQSAMERECLAYISQFTNDVMTTTTMIIPPYEIDIYLPDENIAFEFNGVYWHSETMGKDKTYHLKKTNMCTEKGVRLIHINEDEWILKQDIVKSRIQNILGGSKTLGARKTKVYEITTKEKSKFLNTTHIQGTCNSSINLGLIYDNELVAVMTFGKARYNKNHQYELLRYSNKLGMSVVGGASKLFSYFLKKHQPESVISYSDKRWNTGKLYLNLGFEFSHISKPNYKYFQKSGTVKLLSRQQFQKHKLKDKLKIFDENLTEWENMQANGYTRIWDCGNDVFVWKNKNQN